MNPHYWEAFETADSQDIARRIMKDIVSIVAPAVRPGALRILGSDWIMDFLKRRND
jgi:hypothetical protein